MTAGAGTVFAGASVTNADGLAQERWTVGTVAGAAQALEARAVDNASGQAIVFATFHATAVPDVPRVLLTSTVGAAVRSGEAVTPPPTVRLVDRFGNLVPAPAYR